MAYYGSTQIKEAVGASPTAMRAIQDGSLGMAPGELRAFQDGSLGRLGPGRLRAFQDGSLGRLGPGRLRAFQDGSLGAGPGRLRAFKDGSLGCMSGTCQGVGLPLYVDGRLVKKPMTIVHGEPGMMGFGASESTIVFDISANSPLLSEFKQALAVLLNRSQTVSGNISNPVYDEEAAQLMRDFDAGLKALNPKVYGLYAGDGTPLVLADGTPTYNGAAAVISALAMIDDAMVRQGFPGLLKVHEALVTAPAGSKLNYKAPKKGSSKALYIGLGVGAVLLVGVVALALKK